jgi:hypothetical protein
VFQQLIGALSKRQQRASEEVTGLEPILFLGPQSVRQSWNYNSARIRLSVFRYEVRTLGSGYLSQYEIFNSEVGANVRRGKRVKSLEEIISK